MSDIVACASSSLIGDQCYLGRIADHGVHCMSCEQILIYHIGALGDTLVALPAFRAVRDNFPGAHIVLLTDDQRGKNNVQCQQVLDGSGLVDEYIFYTHDSSLIGKALRFLRMTALYVVLRKRRFDALMYLVRTEKQNPRVKRDELFFKRAGIKRIIGMTGFIMNLTDYAMRPLPMVPHEGDQLLARLADAGIAVPSSSRSGRYLMLSEKERSTARKILGKEHDAGKRTWIAIGPGSKMPAKVWPKERFGELVQRLIAKYDIWPVVFGGSEDMQLGEELVAQWGRGSVAAGALNIRESMAALERCGLYIGNDTGTLHMAVAMGVRCIGLYSARDYPGLWFPHGDGHVVFRHALPCEGCMLEICAARKMACMLAIQVDEVAHAIDRTGRLERNGQNHDITEIEG